MGTWGAALYDDDNASDLRNTLALLCKVPVLGDQLLNYLKKINGHCDPEGEDGALFWLVTADQFERRGIECHEAMSTAISIIKSGSDLARARENGADERFLKKRSAVLQELAKRFKSPRPFRPRVRPRNPPPLVLATGEIYAFPTMANYAWHPYRLPSQGPFKPDGWGALVVLATGRAFEWLPWISLASLTVNPDQKPTLERALRAELIFHSQTLGAGRFVPKPSHARGMGLELLGRTDLDARLVEPQLSEWSVARAIEYDWSLTYGGFGSKAEGLPRGCKLASLIKS